MVSQTCTVHNTLIVEVGWSVGRMGTIQHCLHSLQSSFHSSCIYRITV
jgi:hypothetical protein